MVAILDFILGVFKLDIAINSTVMSGTTTEKYMISSVVYIELLYVRINSALSN